jgi:uncharacterized protein (DUF58 family)
MNSAWIGWAIAATAVAVGYLSYGWPGVLLAFTVLVFGLLLQFSRSLRALRQAGQRPVGQVASAVMLNSRLAHGMTLMQVLKLTGSLGRQVREVPETWAWADAGGDEVQIELHGGKLQRWELTRAATPEASADTPPA